jgi:hypothetical protein
MAKKKNRPKAKPPTRVAVEPVIAESAAEQNTTADTGIGRAAKAPKVTRSQVAAERLEDEYAYITGDLRRVFILAAAMFALLIALNVILGMIG